MAWWEVSSMRKGFTLLEILVALGILLLLGSFTIAAFSNYVKRSLLNEARTKIISEINYARSQTLASEDKSSWGIHFESGRIVRFKGSAYSPADPSNQELLMPRGTTISSISLGGPQDIIFGRLTARASAQGTLIIQLTAEPAASTTIQIYASGIAE